MSSVAPERYIIERHEIGGLWWAVFSGADGEDPHLQALVRDEQTARLLVEVADPTPGEEGRKVIFDGTYTPASVRTGACAIAANDYRVSTHAELEEAQKANWRAVPHE